MKNDFLIIWIGSKNLLPINAKSLLVCKPLMQHQKIEKYIIDLKQSFGNTDSLFWRIAFFIF